jgi:hypothetical protein
MSSDISNRFNIFSNTTEHDNTMDVNAVLYVNEEIHDETSENSSTKMIKHKLKSKEAQTPKMLCKWRT